MNGSLRNKYKIAGPQTWELVRAAYLGGESAQVVAERYGVTVAAIRRRACKEKWTKRHLAEALEARGVAPPPPPAAPDYIEPHIERATERMAEEAEASAELNALVERIASEEDAADIASAIERRALAQASAAMVQGRSKEAQALASMAEMMRKRLGEARRRDDEAEAEKAGDEAQQRRSRETELVQKFRYAAYLAYCMVHDPSGAPAIFVDAIAAVRRDAFGEGDEESIAAARASAAESRRYFGLDEAAWEAAFDKTAERPSSPGGGGVACVARDGGVSAAPSVIPLSRDDSSP